MNRRQFLRVGGVAAVATVTGCADGRGDDRPRVTTENTAAGVSTTADETAAETTATDDHTPGAYTVQTSPRGSPPRGVSNRSRTAGCSS
ncbi:MAG: TAT (twin-arginine translocation) pathway signal sequence, partial [halophilic archaeon J07HB67]